MKTFLALSLYVLTFLPIGLAHADTRSVCERTSQIRDFIAQTVGKPCDEINDADLLQVTAIRVPNSGLTSLKLGDFAGLSRVEVLNLKRNSISELPVGIFDGLTSLRVLVILGNDIHQIPDDFTVANPNLEKIHMFANAFTSLSPQVMRNLQALPKLNVLDVGKELDNETKLELRAAFPRENEHVTLIID